MPEVTLVVADWCPVCPQARALWKKMADRFSFAYREVDISTEEGRATAEEHAILSVPATLIDGRVVFRGVPAPSEAEAQLRKFKAEEK